MSKCWCAFCDKEMATEAYAIYIRDYVTCGGESCINKAKSVYDELLDENKAKTKKDNVLIFSTKTPDKEDSWKIVAKEDHPDFLANHDIVAEMLYGNLYRDKTKTKKEMYYCAILSGDIIIEEPVSEKK